MKLRVQPSRNPAEYVGMSRIAEKCWKDGLATLLEWARDNPRAIIMNMDAQNRLAVQARFDPKHFIVTEEP